MNISRRQAITGAVAIAAASCVPASAVVAHSVEREAALVAKDMLLPGLWAVFGQTGFYSDIDITDCGGLIVQAWRHRTDKGTGLGFLITSQSIRDGHYKAVFAPTVTMLRDQMELTSIPEFLHRSEAKITERLNSIKEI